MKQAYFSNWSSVSHGDFERNATSSLSFVYKDTAGFKSWRVQAFGMAQVEVLKLRIGSGWGLRGSFHDLYAPDLVSSWKPTRCKLMQGPVFLRSLSLLLFSVGPHARSGCRNSGARTNQTLMEP